MVGVFGEKVPLGQANGPDVELVVRGTELYATYETPDGYAAVYDEALGLFCYARVVGGAFQSTGVSVAEAPPPGLTRHAVEDDAVRAGKIKERMNKMGGRARAKPAED